MSGFQLAWNGSTHTCTYYVHVPAACALYDAHEDGCILHPKHVEQGKCNKVTLNNLHQAGLNKPTDLSCSFWNILYYFTVT